MVGITDLGATAAQNSDASSDSGIENDYERFDVSEVAWGKSHPTTAVRGRAVALRKLYDEDDPDRSDVAVILEDPSLVTSEEGLETSRVVMNSEETGDEFKVVNLADAQTGALGSSGKISDPDAIEAADSLMATDFAGNTFYGNVSTEFDLDADQVALKRGGGAGRSITSVLDVNGATAATSVTDDNGEPVLHDGGFPEHNGGLVEYHPDGRDGERPRYARDPQLRDDVVGQDVIIMIQRLSEVDPDYEGSAYWSTVFANMEQGRMDELASRYAADEPDAGPEQFMTELDGDTVIQLQPTDDFEPTEACLVETGYIAFDGNRPTIDELNEARLANGFDEYEPQETQSEA